MERIEGMVIMKKLNLLKPDKRACYLNAGRGSRVEFLNISEELSEKSLSDDVKNGASVFKELNEYVEKKKDNMSRIIILHGNNLENLYMAANYLAAVCNSRECCFDGEYMDYHYYFGDDTNYESYDYDVEDNVEWIESPGYLPIINGNDINNDNFSVQPFYDVPFVQLGERKYNDDKEPYWLSCCKEPVILKYGGSSVFFIEAVKIFSLAIERFGNNRHVFILMYDALCEDNAVDNNELISSYKVDRLKTITRISVETGADMISVMTDEKAIEKYRRIQFDNWLSCMDMKLAKGVNKTGILKRIAEISDDDRSAYFEKILKYIKKDKDGECVLNKEDFKFLDMMRMSDYSKKDKNYSLEKMENSFIGMENVKKQIRTLVSTMKYAKIREERGLGGNDIHNIHMFVGAPGTAKSSVGEFLGNILAEEGLLPGNNYICVNGAELKGKYLGHTAPKIKALFEEYDIIFIDEAYSLVGNNKDDTDLFAQEALAQLMIELEKYGTRKLVIFAGYGGTDVSGDNNKMYNFLEANPGLKSRINSTIFFESYTADEMVQIVNLLAKQKKYSIEPGTEDMIKEYFEKRVTDSTFGNGREARSLLENAIMNAARRVMLLPESKRTKKKLQELTYEDISNAVKSLYESNIIQKGKRNRVCHF